MDIGSAHEQCAGYRIRDPPTPEGELWKLAEWFDEAKADALGAQMQADAEAGRLDFLFDEAEAAPHAAPASRDQNPRISGQIPIFSGGRNSASAHFRGKELAAGMNAFSATVK